MSGTAEPRSIVYCADGVEVARGLADESADLVYLDPPFNTGRRQERERLRTRRAEGGGGD
ncbi:MAG: site-specific DNA-methyltransferase, partial [Dehalococcoidia bacterium]|nr:site-specific DNA-methyltransferase [Dehalococcoidia bacterium]